MHLQLQQLSRSTHEEGKCNPVNDFPTAWSECFSILQETSEQVKPCAVSSNRHRSCACSRRVGCVSVQRASAPRGQTMQTWCWDQQCAASIIQTAQTGSWDFFPMRQLQEIGGSHVVAVPFLAWNVDGCNGFPAFSFVPLLAEVNLLRISNRLGRTSWCNIFT